MTDPVLRARAVPIVHPSWVMRGQWAQGTVQPRFLAVAKAITEGTYVPPPPLDHVPPEANLFPSIPDLHGFASGTSGMYTVDVECPGGYFLCIGILHMATCQYVCVRFLGQHGEPYEPADLEPRAEWLYRFLADPDRLKIFHNGQAFDVPYLNQVGFHVRGYVDDTMLQAHLTYCELPKRLEFLGLIHADMPRWKLLIAESDEAKEEA